jgi:hypothetical protein
MLSCMIFSTEICLTMIHHEYYLIACMVMLTDSGLLVRACMIACLNPPLFPFYTENFLSYFLFSPIGIGMHDANCDQL